MRHITKRAALSVLAGAPAALMAPTVLGQNRASTIVIATGVDPSFAPLVCAIRKGFFEKNGIRAELKIFDDGLVALDSLLTGAGDVGATLEVGGIPRRAKGGQLFVTAQANYTDEFFGLVGSKSIQKPQDLIGKTVGLSVRGGASQLFLTAYARFHGFDFSQLKIKLVGAPEAIPSLARGDIDVICLGEPWLSRAVSAVPNTHYIVKQKKTDNPKFYRLNDYYYFGERLMGDPELSKATMRALIEGSEWVAKNRDEAVKISAEIYKVSNDMSAFIIDMFDYTMTFSPALLATFEQTAEFQKSLGVITTVPDWKTFLRPEVLRAVAPERVTVS